MKSSTEKIAMKSYEDIFYTNRPNIQRTAALKTAVHWLEQYSDTTNYPPSNGFIRFAWRVNFKIVCSVSPMVYIRVQLMTMADQLSLLDGKVCMRAKKCLGSPVLKYSYQDSSVFD